MGEMVSTNGIQVGTATPRSYQASKVDVLCVQAKLPWLELNRTSTLTESLVESNLTRHQNHQDIISKASVESLPICYAFRKKRRWYPLNRYLFLLLVVLASQSHGEAARRFWWGEYPRMVHHVSMMEVLGNPQFFDGQPVAISGVADFSFGFESSSMLFLTKEDFGYLTQNRISIYFGEEFTGPKQNIEALSGRHVTVAGIFHALKRQKIKAKPPLSVCLGLCPAGGRVENVVLVKESILLRNI